MIQARIRAGASWHDACILNLSTRGMLVRAPSVPSRGSYLEIRRGHHVIVARVVWSDANRFGVYTQDPVPAADLVRSTGATDRPVQSAQTGLVERRASQRPKTHEEHRYQARAFEFAGMMGGGLLAAAFLLVTLRDSLKSFGQIAAVLGGSSG